MIKQDKNQQENNKIVVKASFFNYKCLKISDILI